jgi:hypothetical protein
MFEDYYMPEFDVDYFNSPAFQRAIASAVEQYSPTPVEPVYYAPEPVYYAPEPVAGIGRGGEYDYYQPELQAPEVYAEPAPVYYAPPPQEFRGVDRGIREDYYQPGIGYIPEEVYVPAPEPMRTPAVEPMTVEAAPIMGIGSPAVAEADLAPSLIETAVAEPVAAADTGLQVINANDYSPSDTDLQTMKLTRDQWNEAMASLATLDLGNLNFGNFGITNPDYTSNFRTFTAPKSNKGNPTSTVAKKDNTFNLIEGQPIRLVDMRTKKVVFQGTGYEAAEKAIELAAGLTKAGGNKADWEIQTGQFKNPGSGDLVFGDTFKTVANEKRNKSIFNEALDILGDAALGFIIGGPVGAAIAAGASAAGVNVSDIAYPIIATAALGPVGFAGTAGAAALGSAVSSAVQGRSVEETLIRAGVTGLTAGAMSGTNVGGKVSEAVGGVLKDIGVESQVGNIISGIGGQGAVDAATGEIIVNAATDAAAAAITSGATGAAVSEAVVDAVRQVVPDYQPSPETETLLNQVDEAAATAAADPTIVVTANPVTTAVSGANPIVETAAGIAGGFGGIGDVVNSPELRDARVEERARIEEPKEEIVVTATPEPVVTTPAPDVTAGIGGSIIPVEVPPSSVATDAPVEEIVVTGPEAAELPPVNTDITTGIGGIIPPVTTPTPPAETPVEEIVVTAPEVVAPVPETAGIGGGIPGIDNLINSTELQDTIDAEKNRPPEKEKSTLDKIRDAADIASVVLPIVGGAAGSGGDGGTISPDTTRINFTKSTLRPTLTGAGIGGVGGNYPYTPQTYGRAGGNQETEYLFFTKDPVTGQETVQAAPITTPIANEPADPAMILPSGNTFAEGGEVDDDMVKHLVEYHKNGGHQGPGQVKGIGSGQEDKIPAWLSDGEYVWSAQDVADLGDGSTDEGVRRLDKMRQMVRRQAGRKDVKKIAKPQKGIDTMLKAVGGLV